MLIGFSKAAQIAQSATQCSAVAASDLRRGGRTFDIVENHSQRFAFNADELEGVTVAQCFVTPCDRRSSLIAACSACRTCPRSCCNSLNCSAMSLSSLGFFEGSDFIGISTAFCLTMNRPVEANSEAATVPNRRASATKLAD
jgi:hypothetical protein